MHIRRRLPTSLVLAFVAASGVALVPVVAQQQKRDPKLEKAMAAEVQAVVRIADAVAAGQPAPGDIALTLRTDFLKAQENRTYVPFTVSIDPAELPSKAVAMYMRVVNKNPPVPSPSALPLPPPLPAADAKKDTKAQKKAAAPEYTFQEVYFLDVKAAEPGQSLRISRAFAVPAGEYELFVVLKERAPIETKDKNAVQKAGFVRQSVTVPNYWTAELTTSSVILAEKVEPLTAPLSAREQAEQPYTFGMTQIVPALSSRFSKKVELSVVFLIYNTAMDTNKKPDVAVEYAFYQKVAGAEKGEKFFNKTSPQAFNATTLPPQFDPAMGHQLVAGQSVPLVSFPEGGYRLEIKVTDKLSGKTLTQNLEFNVAS
ncbi:MAG: hypothetical protein AABY89_02820 [Acidobacteriota bacterium]